VNTQPPTPTPLAPYVPPQFTSAGAHLLDRLSVLYRYRRAAVTAFITVVAWIMLGSYTEVPQYRASARILIEDETSGMPSDLSQGFLYYQDPEPYHQTQRRILQGRAAAQRVAQRLDLSKIPEFNGQGPTPTAIGQAIATVKNYAKRPLRMLTGSDGPPLVDSEPARGETRDDSRYIASLLAHFSVQDVRGSRLVDLNYVSTDPQVAALIANTWGEEYINQNLESKVKNLQDQLEWLAGEVRKQQEKVEQSERALAEYRERQNAVSLGNNQNIVVSRLQQLNSELTRANTTRVQKEILWRQVQAAEGDREQLATIISTPAIQTLRLRLAELQRLRGAQQERYGNLHPTFKDTLAQIENTTREYNAEVDKAARTFEAEYRAATSEEQSLKRDLDAQTGAAMDLNRKNVDYSVLERNAASNTQLYNTLLQREKELRIVANSRVNNVRMVEAAQVPGGPFTPNHRNDWFLALVLGVGVALALAFGIDYLDDTVKTPEDITHRLKLRFLGLVPAVRGERHPLLSGPVPHDFSEAFRALRTSLVAHASTEGTRMIAITSAQPLEGKTTTAVNIAMALAVGGARVMLIDADMRRPSVHKALRLTNDRGLSQLLAGQARMREVVQRTHDPNLLVISAGRTPSNPSELLASDRMRALVSGLDTGPFDWVIIDTPPVLAVTDAVILAPLVGAVTFVIGAEMTRWRLVERAVETVMAGNPRAITAVLNKVDFMRNKYYYSRYYGHQYKSYYSEAPAA
jgi:polysaccharide biosynthesis transport protein